MNPQVVVDVPAVSILSYDQDAEQYTNVTAGTEQVASRMTYISGMVNYHYRGSVTQGERITHIALRFEDITLVEAMDQFAGHVAVTAAKDGQYRIYPLFLTQLETDDSTRLYLRQHPGTFTSFYADTDDIIQVHANWLA